MRKDINLLFLFLSPSLTLKGLTYPLILSNIKTNGLTTLPKNPIKYLESFFVLIKLEITILSTLTSWLFIGLFVPQNSSFATFVLPNLNIILSKKNVSLIFR